MMASNLSRIVESSTATRDHVLPSGLLGASITKNLKRRKPFNPKD